MSALGQVVALKLLLHDGMLDQINTHLPPQIRMLGIRRVTASFDPRKMCDRRHYEYMLPAWALDPSMCRPAAAAQNGHVGEAPSLLACWFACTRWMCCMGLCLQRICPKVHVALEWQTASSRLSASYATFSTV